MIARNEVSAGIPHDGNLEMANFLEHVGAEAIAVSKFRAGIVDTLIDSAAQMLEEGAKDISIKASQSAPRIKRHAVARGGWRRGSLRKQKGCKRLLSRDRQPRRTRLFQEAPPR